MLRVQVAKIAKLVSVANKRLNSEIAQKLNMTQEQVNSRLEYARKQIRKLFEEEGVCL